MVMTLDLGTMAWYTKRMPWAILTLLAIFVSETTLDDAEKKAEANAKVTFEANRHITVNLGSEWSSSVARGWLLGHS